ncbi:MAG TPA: hypothetical protein VHV10_05015 [Ktedonobacteraceae bacterium]|jgi:hypothetical protein|nr:hypothetical protein [Ktedonobacteraceae bacterium]
MAVQVPERDVHARFLAAGLTRYAYEEIVDAIDEFGKCEQEYEVLALQAFEIIGDHDKYFGSIGYAPEHIRALYAQMHSGLIPSIQSTKGSKEAWPVKTWQKEVSRYRTLNKKVQKAISIAQSKEAECR